MKKFIATIALVSLASTAFAQHQHGGYRNSWVGPALIGGVVGYGIARNYYNPYYGYVPPPVVYVQQSPTVIYNQSYTPQQVCEPRTIQQPNGEIISGNFCYYK